MKYVLLKMIKSILKFKHFPFHSGLSRVCSDFHVSKEYIKAKMHIHTGQL